MPVTMKVVCFQSAFGSKQGDTLRSREDDKLPSEPVVVQRTRNNSRSG